MRLMQKKEAGEVVSLFWSQIKKIRGVRPIVRRYLTEYMKSRFLKNRNK